MNNKHIEKIVKKEKFLSTTDFLVFTHIPKCGGTSLHKMLFDAFQGNYVHVYPGSWNHDSFLNSYGAGGHQPFGQLPIEHIDKDFIYITLMREPFERFKSFYTHVQCHREHHLHQELLKYSKPLDFAKYLFDIGNYEISNGQSKLIAGNVDGNKLNEQAQLNLDKHFTVVGKCEQMSEFNEKVSELINVNFSKTERLNVSSKKNEEIFSSRELKKYIELINDIDYQLYYRV